jgi:hypothetical protein
MEEAFEDRRERSYDKMIEIVDGLQREIDDMFDKLLKEISDDHDTSLLRREWRRLGRIDIN